jgi:hypothetical protein
LVTVFKLFRFNNLCLKLCTYFRKGKSETRGSPDTDYVKRQLMEFSGLVEKDVKTLIADNLSEIVPYFLPTVVASDENSELVHQFCNKKKISRASEIHQVIFYSKFHQCAQRIFSKKTRF